MKLKKYMLFVLCASALTVLALGCGEDPGMYQGETLTFETPVSSKSVKQNKGKQELNLSEDDASNFHFTRFGGWYPWAGYPLYDYYLEPVPVPVPVSPAYALIEYIHPFYAWGQFEDDDDGLYFRHDDD